MRSYKNLIRQDYKISRYSPLYTFLRSSCVVGLFSILCDNVILYSGIIGSEVRVKIQKFIEVEELSRFRLELMNEFPRVSSDFLGKVRLIFPELSRFFHMAVK